MYWQTDFMGARFPAKPPTSTLSVLIQFRQTRRKLLLTGYLEVNAKLVSRSILFKRVLVLLLKEETKL